LKVLLRLNKPRIPGADLSFEILDRRLPSPRSLGVSFCIHVGIAWILAAISLPAPPAAAQTHRSPDGRQIRVGDRLYYVARLAPPDAPQRKSPVRKALRPAPVAARAKAAPPPPRAFIPPEIKRDPAAAQTLIQPDSPPDLPPVAPNLPPFRIWAAEIPKIPKPFVAPGQQAAPPADPQLLAQPSFDLSRARPAFQISHLTLPPAPAPLDLPPAPEMPQLPPGDPVNIVSLSNNPPLPLDLVKVPAGNVVAETNPGPVSSGSSAAPAVNPASGSAAATPAPAAATKDTVILRPANGNFDTVVVQSSPLDLFPEGRSLLTGRPVYTVYIVVGAAKDWSLYFCVPGQKLPDSSATPGIVELTPPAPIRAPYPTRIVRPGVSLPRYQKYVLLHAIVSENGRFRELRVVNPGMAETDRAILSAVSGWEFRPADRDGVPIAVEILLAIPAAGL
jgi:hypothetical protein